MALKLAFLAALFVIATLVVTPSLCMDAKTPEVMSSKCEDYTTTPPPPPQEPDEDYTTPPPPPQEPDEDYTTTPPPPPPQEPDEDHTTMPPPPPPQEPEIPPWCYIPCGDDQTSFNCTINNCAQCNTVQCVDDDDCGIHECGYCVNSTCRVQALFPNNPPNLP